MNDRRWQARQSNDGWWGVWDRWSDCWDKDQGNGRPRQWASKSGAQRAARQMNSR